MAKTLSPWRAVALVPLFFFTLYLALMGLVLGSWSIQWFAAYVHLFGSLVLLVMIGGAVRAVIWEQPMRPWLIRYLVIFVVMVVADVVSSHIIDATFKGDVVG